MTIEEWLNNDQLGIDIWNKKYRYNNETLDEWFDRVSGGDQEIRKLIVDKKFLFGGRILSGRGIDNVKCSLSNCYVIKAPEDSIESIFECGAKLARTFSYGGGCGIDISKLRCVGAKVNNAAKTTSGAVSFMDFFSYITGLICQQGRRGALMISISCEHPDIEDFIQIKKDLNKVTKANISIRMTDKFMSAAKSKQDVTLSFTAETGETISKVVNAYDILNQIAQANWTMGEPGMLYWDQITRWNLLSNNSEFEYAGVNPCAEEPLPAGGSCLLGSLNLSEFVENGQFNYNSFRSAICATVRGLNQVLDEGLYKHPLIEQQNSVRDWRQIGLGIFGLADCLIKLKIKYGKDSIEFINKIGYTLINEALISSAYLAKEQGCYPKYNDGVLETDFFQSVASDETKRVVRKYGLRNSQLLTCAPTGSLASLINCSGSAEPLYATSYTRRTISLNNGETYYRVYPKIIKEFIDQGYTEKNLPSYIITSENIPYKERIDVQAALNYYIDASISSTVNLKESTTVQEIADLYLYAWKKRCKGITVWRNNCSRQSILSTIKPEIKDSNENQSPKFDHITPVSRKTLGTTHGSTSCKKCACGTLYITCNKDDKGNLVEVFTHTSKGGICQANMNAVTRLISLNLRSGVKVDEVIDQVRGINCPACNTCKARGINIDGLSCPDIISRVIKEAVSENTKFLLETPVNVVNTSINQDIKTVCPECGEPLVATGGCVSCLSCGFSHCG